MNQGLIPNRYAKALYKFAVEHGTDTRLYEMMTQLTKAFIENPSMQHVMSNPFVNNDDKLALLHTAAGATPKDKDYDDFLKLLVENNRVEIVRAIAIAYRQIYRKEHNIYVVDVTSAAPLAPSELKRLKDLIQARLNGGSMEFSQHVDPELIGGFVVKINNERLDASVANELARMRQNFVND